MSSCIDNRFAKPSPSPIPQGVAYRKIEQNCCVIDILKTPAERRGRGNVSGMVDVGYLSSHCDLALLTLIEDFEVPGSQATPLSSPSKLPSQ